MRATLLLYSGRENPTWSIEDDLARRITTALAQLSEAPRVASSGGGPGYSGVRLDFHDADGRSRTVVLGGGIALVDGCPFVDADRRLERTILSSGGGEVPEIDRLI